MNVTKLDQKILLKGEGESGQGHRDRCKFNPVWLDVAGVPPTSAACKSGSDKPTRRIFQELATSKWPLHPEWLGFVGIVRWCSWFPCRLHGIMSFYISFSWEGLFSYQQVCSLRTP